MSVWSLSLSVFYGFFSFSETYLFPGVLNNEIYEKVIC